MTKRKAEEIDDGKNQDNCLICQHTLSIPVIPAQTCLCDQVVCMKCHIDRVEVYSNPTKILTNYKCLLNCGASYKNVPKDSSYTLLGYKEFYRLDKLYGDIKCPVCEKWKGSRSSYITEHKDVCSKEYYKKCDGCKKVVNINEHNIECEYCLNEITLCTKRKHYMQECIVIYACEPDLKEITTCEFKINSSSRCKRCGLISGDHDCIFWLDVLQKLNISTPYSRILEQVSLRELMNELANSDDE